MKNQWSKKTLLCDLGVTVGLLAVTLLSFMSMRVVPMGTSWYLPYCASVGVGIIAVLCAVLFWDMVKGGKLGTDACGDCGEPSARYNIPFYLYISPKGKTFAASWRVS